MGGESKQRQKKVKEFFHRFIGKVKNNVGRRYFEYRYQMGG